MAEYIKRESAVKLAENMDLRFVIMEDKNESRMVCILL